MINEHETYIEGEFLTPAQSLENMILAAKELTEEIEQIYARLAQLQRMNDGSYGQPAGMLNPRWIDKRGPLSRSAPAIPRPGTLILISQGMDQENRCVDDMRGQMAGVELREEIAR